MPMQLLVTAMMVASGLGMSGHNWMSTIQNIDIQVSELSIPGTHDSASYKGWLDVYTRTQDRSIYRQLDIGVRFLDLRVHMEEDDQNKADPFTMRHNKVYVGLKYQEAFNEMKKFLDKNPKECIIVRLKAEGMDDGWDARMKNAFMRAYHDPNRVYYLMQQRVPTLRECQKKIWIIQQSMGLAGNGVERPGQTFSHTLWKKQDYYTIWSQTPSNEYDQNDKKDDIYLFHKDTINGENLRRTYYHGNCGPEKIVHAFGGCDRGYISSAVSCLYKWMWWDFPGWKHKCTKGGRERYHRRGTAEVAINFYSAAWGAANPNLLSAELNPLVFELSGHFGISVFDFPTMDMVEHVFTSQPHVQGSWKQKKNQGPRYDACIEGMFFSLGDAKTQCDGNSNCAYIFGPRKTLDVPHGRSVTSYSKNRFYTMRSSATCWSCPSRDSVPPHLKIQEFFSSWGSVWYRPGAVKSFNRWSETGRCTRGLQSGRRLEERLLSAAEVISREERPASFGAVELDEAEEIAEKTE